MPQARPPKSNTRTKGERLEVRVIREQKRMLTRAAALQGRSLTEFVVTSAQEAAMRVIEAHENIDRGERDRRAFVEALLRPKAPGKTLRGAAERFKARMKT